jgi:hypothetical protein
MGLLMLHPCSEMGDGFLAKLHPAIAFYSYVLPTPSPHTTLPMSAGGDSKDHSQVWGPL